MRALFKNIKRLWGTPRALPVAALFLLALTLIIVSLFFVPLYLGFLTVIVFAGMAAAGFYGVLRLAYLEEKHESSAQELQAVIKNMQEGVVVYTPQFKITDLNPAAENILKIKRPDIVGQTVTPASGLDEKLKTLTQIIYPSLAPSVTTISEVGWPQIVEITTENNLQLLTVLGQLVDEAGNITGFVKIIQDRTREKELIDSKTEFITTSAHQLRTPLTAMGWAFENLNKSLGDKPELQKISTEGLNLSARGLKIINDMLESIQIEEGRFGHEFKDTDLVELAKEVAEETRQATQEYGLRFSFSPPTKPYPVNADPRRLGAVFSILIDNAIKYNTEGGSVTLALEKTSDGRFAKVLVSDTGVGIPKDEAKHIFDKFYRGGRAAKLEPNGSGLGLFMAKNIVEKHGGVISVDSVENRGTTFHFTIPLKGN